MKFYTLCLVAFVLCVVSSVVIADNLLLHVDDVSNLGEAQANAKYVYPTSPHHTLA